MIIIKIYYIYADNCKHCLEVLSTIELAISQCEKIACEIVKYRYDSSEAINLAIHYGIDDLPGVVIGSKSFVKECKEKDIIEAVKNASKTTKGYR